MPYYFQNSVASSSKCAGSSSASPPVVESLGNESLLFSRSTFCKTAPTSCPNKAAMLQDVVKGASGGIIHPAWILPWYPETASFRSVIKPLSLWTRNSRNFSQSQQEYFEIPISMTLGRFF